MLFTLTHSTRLFSRTKGDTMQPYSAHIDREGGHAQSLAQHTNNVALLSAQFASSLQLAQTARLIALLHDKKLTLLPPRAQSLLMSTGFPATRCVSVQHKL